MGISEDLTFKDLCEQKGVVYSNALYQRKKHPSLSDIEVIECCLKPKNELTKEEREKYYLDKKKPFRVLCIENGIDFSKAYMFKSRHSGLTDNEIIEYYLNKSLKKLCKQNEISFKKALLFKDLYNKLLDIQLNDNQLVEIVKKVNTTNVDIVIDTVTREDLEKLME